MTLPGFQRIHEAVPKLRRLIVCWAMLVGLVGNGVALAAPCVLMPAEQQSAAMEMGEDCHSEQNCSDCSMQSDASPAPQKDKAAGCLAMVACTAVLALPETGGEDASDHSGVDAFPAVVIALAGRNLAPEPDPPTQLS